MTKPREKKKRERDGEEQVGWFVWVSKGLKEQFTELYPTKGAATALTLAAIRRAIAIRPQLEDTMADSEAPRKPPSAEPPSDIRSIHRGQDTHPTPMFTAKAPDDKKAVAQTILEARRLARSIEATLEATYPLTEHPDVIRKIEAMQAHMVAVSKDLLEIYTPWAREAFKE